MSEEGKRLIELIDEPLKFYSSEQLEEIKFRREYLETLERDEFKLAKISLTGGISYLGGYLLGRAQKDKLGIRDLLRDKPSNYSNVCPFAFCEAMQVHPDELPETIIINGKSLSLIDRVQIGEGLQFRIPVPHMAYISLPVIEDIPLTNMTNEELVRRHRVSGDETYREVFLDRYKKDIRSLVGLCESFRVAIEQMGRAVLENQARNGASEAFLRFDLTRGILLTTYLHRRVKGAVIDYLRELDEVPRSVRRAVKIMRKYYEKDREEGVEFDLDDFSTKTGISPEIADLALLILMNDDRRIPSDRSNETTAEHRVVSLKRISLDRSNETIAEHRVVSLKDVVINDPPLSSNPMKLHDVRDGISKLLEGLKPIDRELIVAYYYDQSKMRAIGKSLGFSESRISQLLHGIGGEGGILSRLRERAAEIFPEYVPREFRNLIQDP